jgi:hypothetical protein
LALRQKKVCHDRAKRSGRITDYYRKESGNLKPCQLLIAAAHTICGMEKGGNRKNTSKTGSAASTKRGTLPTFSLKSLDIRAEVRIGHSQVILLTFRGKKKGI